MIKQDHRSYRLRDDKNKKIIKKSLSRLGAGRSILIDSSDEIIAGNATYEQAQELGIPVRVVETDGTELIVVKRKDLKPDDIRRKELAVADNYPSAWSTFDVDAINQDFDASDLAEWNSEANDTLMISDDSDDIDFQDREAKSNIQTVACPICGYSSDVPSTNSGAVVLIMCPKCGHSFDIQI